MASLLNILEGAEVQRVDGERPGSPRRGGLRRRRRHTQRHAQRLIGHAAAPCSEQHPLAPENAFESYVFPNFVSSFFLLILNLNPFFPPFFLFFPFFSLLFFSFLTPPCVCLELD